MHVSATYATSVAHFATSATSDGAEQANATSALLPAHSSEVGVGGEMLLTMPEQVSDDGRHGDG